MRAAGDAMQGAGIADAEVLLIADSLTAAHGPVEIYSGQHRKIEDDV